MKIFSLGALVWHQLSSAGMGWGQEEGPNGGDWEEYPAVNLNKPPEARLAGRKL